MKPASKIPDGFRAAIAPIIENIKRDLVSREFSSGIRHQLLVTPLDSGDVEVKIVLKPKPKRVDS